MASEVLPIVRETPVLAGVCGTDPFRLMDVFLDELRRIGFSGVQNFPTVGLFDGTFRQNLEETGMGYGLEVEMIRLAHDKDLLTAPYVFTVDEAAAFIERRSFTTGPSRRVGVELEWLVEPRGDLETGWDLPGGGSVSREAGGQVEMSSAPADDLASCIASAETDQAALEAALATRGQTVRGGGFDGSVDPVRYFDDARYRTMEAYYDRDGPWGRLVLYRFP